MKDMNEILSVLKSFGEINRITAQLSLQNAARFGLTIKQLSVLNLLYNHRNITLDELSKRLFSSKSSMSVAIDHLVKIGLVDRVTCEEDRRAVSLSATEKGAELAKMASEDSLVIKALSYAIAQLPDEDVEEMLRIHADMEKHLTEAVSELSLLS